MQYLLVTSVTIFPVAETELLLQKLLLIDTMVQ